MSCDHDRHYAKATFESTEDYDRFLEIGSGFHCEQDGGSSHGVAGMDFFFSTRRKDGRAAASLEILSDWMLPRTFEKWSKLGLGGRSTSGPPPSIIHTHRPAREGEDAQECPVLGVPCVAESIFCAAEEVYAVLAGLGVEAMFEELERWAEGEL